MMRKFILAALLLFSPAAQADPKGDVFDGAAELFYTTLNKDGLNGVIVLIPACYDLARIQEYKLSTTTMCSALDIGAAKFDVGFMGLAGRDPSLSVSGAERRAGKSLLLAGVPAENIDRTVVLIGQKVTTAINRRVLRDPAVQKSLRSTGKKSGSKTNE